MMAERPMEAKQQPQQQQHEKADDPQRKLVEGDDSSSAVETKTITTIYYDCLERIFGFLDVESLLMVAQTCKRLQIAAAAKFDDDFGNNCIRFDLDVGSSSIGLNYPNRISVNGLKFCLPFLRCFGDKITTLHAFYGFHEQDAEHLDEYINRYCANTLTSFSFQRSEFTNTVFEKPFKSVERVVVTDCYLWGETLPNIANWFPNMRHLDVMDCTIASTATVDVHFPRLKHLKLLIGYDDTYNDQNENATNILLSNQQLKSLEIDSIFLMRLGLLLPYIHGNSTITKLQIKTWCDSVYQHELERIVAEHPSMEELILLECRLIAVDAINFIRQMKSLKRFEFEVYDRIQRDRIRNEFEGEWKSVVATDHHIIGFHIKLNR